MTTKKITKKELYEAWNEIEECVTDFNELSDKQIIACRKAIQQRLEKALAILHPFVNNKEDNQ